MKPSRKPAPNTVRFAVTLDARTLDEETQKRVGLSAVSVQTRGGHITPEFAKRFWDLLVEMG